MKGENKHCILCGTLFIRPRWQGKGSFSKRKYCSRKCSARSTASRRSTPERSRKQSETLKRLYREKVTFTEEHRRNISKSLKSSEKAKAYHFKSGKDNPAYGSRRTGSLNPNWKGGITGKNQKLRNDPRMRIWRKAVFKRDNYTCQICGARDYIQAHHKVMLSEDFSLAFDVDNGMSVCVECHEKIHGRYIGKFKQKPVNETNRVIK